MIGPIFAAIVGICVAFSAIFTIALSLNAARCDRRRQDAQILKFSPRKRRAF